MTSSVAFGINNASVMLVGKVEEFVSSAGVAVAVVDAVANDELADASVDDVMTVNVLLARPSAAGDGITELDVVTMDTAGENRDEVKHIRK